MKPALPASSEVSHRSSISSSLSTLDLSPPHLAHLVGERQEAHRRLVARLALAEDEELGEQQAQRRRGLALLVLVVNRHRAARRVGRRRRRVRGGGELLDLRV